MPIQDRLAFDTRLYLRLDTKAVATDLASLGFEAKLSETEIDGIYPERIWHYDHLPEKLSTDPDQLASTQAALNLKSQIYSTPPEAKRLILLVSPPDPKLNYRESRLDIALVENHGGEITFNAYGIPASWDETRVLNYVRQFQPLSDLNSFPLEKSEAITTPIPRTFYSQSDLESAAPRYLPLPNEVWRQILSGEVNKRCEDLTQQLTPIAQAMLSETLTAKTGSDFVKAGAKAEKALMRITGFRLSGEFSGCGLLNSEISSAASGFVTLQREKNGICVKIKCPLCGWEPTEEQLKNMPKSCPGKDKDGKVCGYIPKSG